MATTNGAIGAVDPNNDKTLKLENVSREKRMLNYADSRNADRETRHFDRN